MRLLVAIVVLTAGCGAAQKRDAARLAARFTAIDPAHRPVDGAPAELEAQAIEALLASHPDLAESPEVLWRQARLQVRIGLEQTHHGARIDLFSKGRDAAIRCLETDPAVRRRRATSGWPSALEVLPPRLEPCLEQLGWAWARWYVESGPLAAHADTPDLAAILEQAPVSEGYHGGWASALFEGWRPRRVDEGTGEAGAAARRAGWGVRWERGLDALSELPGDGDPAWEADKAALRAYGGETDRAERFLERSREGELGDTARARAGRAWVERALHLRGWRFEVGELAPDGEGDGPRGPAGP
jgi:hypothetical protein